MARMSPEPSKWSRIIAADPQHSYRYIQRFKMMEANGHDLYGEARTVDAMVGRNARILDAGCGPGRLCGYLHERGHTVVGVDVDPVLIAAATLLGLAAVYEAVVGVTLHWLTGWFVYPALIYAGACVLSKRLHDRGKSGWWAALILFALVAVWPQPVGFFDFLFGLALVWAAVELGIMGSEMGANRFGPNPMRPASA